MKETAAPIVENDLVVIHVETKPGFFARVEEILPDRKPGWWQVRLLPLSLDNLDFQTIVWILDDGQIHGEEFTMQSIPMRLEKIKPFRPVNAPPTDPTERGRGKVISLVKK